MVVKPKEKIGYTLLDLGNKRFQIIAPKMTYTGLLPDVIEFALYVLGFDRKEIDLAVSEMDKGFFDAAEFGFRKTFMYPYDREVKNEKTYVN